jgi:hypothetical protein
MAKSFGKISLFIVKSVGVLLFAFIILVLAVAAFFIGTPEFNLGTQTARELVAKYVPSSIQIEFSAFEVQLRRPADLPFAKRLSLKTRDFCVRYEGQAVRACFGDVGLAAVGGWGGVRLEGESKWMPRIIHIDPIRVLAGDVSIDLTAFPPKKDGPKKEGGFDVLGFIRKDVLPKWELEGSRIEMNAFSLKADKGSAYAGRFQLVTGESGDTLRLSIDDFHQIAGPMKVKGLVRILRPGGLLQNLPLDQADFKNGGGWQIFLGGEVDLDKARSLRVRGDAAIPSWRKYNFRVASQFKGVSVLREARVEGEIDQDLFKGIFSLKMGEVGGVVRTLDFVNCALNANLEKKIGGLRCGPQSVALQVREGKFVRKRELYRFYPEFDLKMTQIHFGAEKSADIELGLQLEHMELISLKSDFKGNVHSKDDKWFYSANGTTDVLLPRFRRLVQLLRGTVVAVPAPFNTLDGQIALQTTVGVKEDGGRIGYQLSSQLDAVNGQAVHLNFSGNTDLVKTAKGVKPKTDASLLVHKLTLMMPRFDLRAPPRFAPDGRFLTQEQRLTREKKQAKKVASEPLGMRLHVQTSAPEAIHLVTNMTKGPIPISLDIVYDDGKSAPAVTGWVTVGNTPVELFRRNAVVEELRVDLQPSGEERLSGRVSVNYLDYAIQILLMGSTKEPRVQFVSDPPLEQNQIVSVLIFGRPLDELDEDQKGSVATLNAQMANAVLGISSLYLLASTPIESVGYNPTTGLVSAKVGLGGGASIEVGGGHGGQSDLGFRKRLTRELVFRSDVETVTTTGERTVSALIEWVKRF